MGIAREIQNKTFGLILKRLRKTYEVTLAKCEIDYSEIKKQSDNSNREGKRLLSGELKAYEDEFDLAKRNLEQTCQVCDAWDNDTYLTTNEEYFKLIEGIMFFYKHNMKYIERNALYRKKLTTEHIPEFIRKFVLASKKENVSIEFLEYFDINGKVIPEKSPEFYDYIYSYITEFICKIKKSGYKENIDIDGFMESIVPEVYVLDEKKKREKQKEIERLKRLKEQELRKAESKKEKKQLLGSSPGANQETKEKLPLTNEEKIMKLYEERKLPQYFLNGGSIEILDNVLRPYLTREEWKEVGRTYNKIKRTSVVERIFGKDKLKELLHLIDIEEYERFIASSNFDNMSDDEIKTTIRMMIPTSNDNLVNAILFTNTLLGTTPSKSVIDQLSKLKVSDTKFIELVCNNQKFVLDGTFNAYAYGNPVSRVCFINISLHKDNQDKLRKRYGNRFTKILLVFGMGNVDFENSLYADSVKDLKSERALVYELYSLFSTPFTPEDEEKAIRLIDNGLTIIGDFTTGEETNNGGSKSNKKKNRR